MSDSLTRTAPDARALKHEGQTKLVEQILTVLRDNDGLLADGDNRVNARMGQMVGERDLAFVVGALRTLHEKGYIQSRAEREIKLTNKGREAVGLPREPGPPIEVEGDSLEPVAVAEFTRLPLNGRVSRSGKIVEAFLASGESVVRVRAEGKKASNLNTSIVHYLKSRELVEKVLTRACDGVLYLALAKDVQGWQEERERVWGPERFGRDNTSDDKAGDDS